MEINNIQLSPELIAALYPETLVTEKDPDTGKKPGKIVTPVLTPSPVFSFLGENLRSICFLVDYPDNDFLPEEQLVFLRKMLSACKCSLDDIALVNMAHSDLQLSDLKKQLKPRIIFLWGIRPATIGLDKGLPDFNISPVDGISVIPIVTPDLMCGDSPQGLELKQRLWFCLKKLFKL